MTITPSSVAKATGLSLAALLALAACGSGEGEPAPPAEDLGAASETDENGAQEGDEDQDPEPAEEDDQAEDEPEASGEVPALEDIYEDMMAAMRSQDSVTMQGVGSGLGMAEELGPGFEDAEDETTFTLEGAIGAQHTLWTLDLGAHSIEMLILEDTGYISGDFFSHILEAQAETMGMGFDASGYNADYGDAWIESDDFVDPGMHIDSFLDEIDLDTTIGPLAPEGELSEYEGQEVWIYAEDGVEIAVLADESDPMLVYLIGEELGEHFEMHFSGWSSTEVPDEPTGQVIPESEMDQIIGEYLS